MPTKPIRDPSLDTLLEGLEERLDQGREAAKLRVHTPPSAHTDPFPEEPVVAPHLTAPLSSRKAALRVDRNASARPTRKLDPTFVLERPEGITARTALVTGSAVVAVLGALGVAVWVPRGSDAVPVLPRAEPVPSIVALAAPPAPLEPIVVRSPPSAATKASGAHPKLPPKAVPSSGLGVDGRLD